MSDDAEPLSETARELLASERGHIGRPPPHFAERVWERISQTVIAPPPTSLPDVDTSGVSLLKGALTRLSLVALGAVAGGTVMASWRSNELDDVRRQLVEAQTARTAPAAPATVPASVPPPPPLPPPAPGEPTSLPVPRSRASAPQMSALQSEANLIERARTALLRREPAEALAAIVEHASQFPQGALAEEREALRVQALVHLDHMDDARKAADAFHRAFPGSLLQEGIDQMVAPP